MLVRWEMRNGSRLHQYRRLKVTEIHFWLRAVAEEQEICDDPEDRKSVLRVGNSITLAVLIAPLLLVAVEERALAAVIRVIGVPYQRRMRRTKRFVPFLF
jgi:hypothetical protein